MSVKPTKIDFSPHHKPTLDAGEYSLTVNQELTGTDATNAFTETIETTSTFYIAGERFQIKPSEIGAVFPPNHSTGDYRNVLPHITLRRSTLPWERRTSPDDDETPWLTLIVIHESDEKSVQVNTVPRSELDAFYPPNPAETSDKVRVLDIKAGLAGKLVRGKSSLRHQAHVRQGKNDAGDQVGEELAVLVASRLPRKGERNTVYLTSMEDRFSSGADGSFHKTGPSSSFGSRFVVLHSWSFTATEHFKVSTHLPTGTEALDAAVETKLKKLTGEDYYTEDDFEAALKEKAGFTDAEFNTNKEVIYRHFEFGDFASILKHLDRTTKNLRIPDTTDATLNPYLAMGFYPLPHQFREGSKSASWYHGPLAPKSNAETFSFPVQSSDQLVRFYEENGMFDVSYASAWELGRLLALQNTHFSTQLYQWKRRYAKKLNQHEQIDGHDISHLQGSNRQRDLEVMPETVSKWFTELELLKGVPFNYLVPDESLLPPESIRFFQLDKLWMRSMIDGAFSIGRVSSKDHSLDQTLNEDELSITDQAVSGFILRSEVVPGWPQMFIEAYGGGTELTVIRRDTLSENVLICLFEGTLDEVNFHLKPEVLHFGVTYDDATKGYVKVMRDTDGNELSGAGNEAFTIPVSLNKANLMMSIDTLMDDINDAYANNAGNTMAWHSEANSAELALQLLEGVEKVVFNTGVS